MYYNSKRLTEKDRVVNINSFNRHAGVIACDRHHHRLCILRHRHSVHRRRGSHREIRPRKDQRKEEDYMMAWSDCHRKTRNHCWSGVLLMSVQ
jgi:hypothetical protein